MSTDMFTCPQTVVHENGTAHKCCFFPLASLPCLTCFTISHSHGPRGVLEINPPLPHIMLPRLHLHGSFAPPPPSFFMCSAVNIGAALRL